MSYKGIFVPKNTKKYKGDYNQIIYRSLWERNLMIEFDRNIQVIQWNSEEYIIPYKSPVDNKIRRYFVDFWMMKQISENQFEEFLVEVKPYKQCFPPNPEKKHKTKTGRVSRRFLNEAKTFGINIAKWRAADKFCQENNMKFVVLTEKGEYDNWRQHLLTS